MTNYEHNPQQPGNDVYTPHQQSAGQPVPDGLPPPTPAAPDEQRQELERKQATKRIHAWVGGTIIGLIALCTIGVLATANSGDEPGTPVDTRTSVEEARSICAPGAAGMTVGDAGSSLTVTGAGMPGGPTIEQVGCVLGGLDVPDSVISQIGATRALDGMQNAEWDKFAASWTYHPDDGLWMVIEER